MLDAREIDSVEYLPTVHSNSCASGNWIRFAAALQELWHLH
eukprot:COSAG05_NODE_22665_length_263_cov_0.634146_1_plen_40_part_01